MSFEADLRTHLLTVAEVGERIFPIVRPSQGPGLTLPAITYQRIAGVPMNDLDGDDGNLLNIRMQIDVWATTHDAVKLIAEAVRARMQVAAATFRAVLLLDQDVYEEEVKIFRVSMDFSCWYRTS